MTPLIKETIKTLSAGDIDPTEFQWFDLSYYVNDQSRAITEPLMTHRPPFEKNLVVWRGKTRNHESYDTIFMVVGNDPQEGILVTMWKGPTGIRPQRFPAMVYVADAEMLRYGSMDDGVELEKDVAELMLAYVGNWLESLSLKNEAYAPVVQKTFTNRRKIAQGKMPTYDWTTVIIEPVKARQEDKGGTHASPRLHDRRGHLRRLQNGKTCWVKPHKVGDASKGTVFHDYQIKGQS
ncbi:hypothetical protein EBX93_04965 [bacterium]|jgi:hypothetical protein|nr:hypothetical protein [bacterium]